MENAGAFSTEPDFCAEEARKLSEKAILNLSVVQKIEDEIKNIANNGKHSTHITVSDYGLADNICWYFNNRGFSTTKLSYNSTDSESEIIISW